MAESRGLDFDQIRTYSIEARKSKVQTSAFARTIDAGESLEDFLDGLSDFLAVRQLRGLAAAIVESRAADRPVIWAMGGHVVKVGLAPVLLQLMERRRVTSLVMNGSAAIHDWELAAIGATSEDVAAELADGRFGMAEETGREFADAAREAHAGGHGLGAVLGRRIEEQRRPFRETSVLARAHALGVPVSVHVAIGCDIVHQHPAMDGAAVGAATYTDFRGLVERVADLEGGVWINCGSAVQLPEVFLKALSVARNLGHARGAFSTANLDMLRHYRTQENVLRRPVLGGGQSFQLTGHHEINVPLLAAAIELASSRRVQSAP